MPPIAAIKEEAEKLFIARRTEKLNVFLEFTYLTVGPHISADGLERLRDCIARYAREKALPDGLTPIKQIRAATGTVRTALWLMIILLFLSFAVGYCYLETHPWKAKYRQLE